ncbi:pyruvate kinase, partial [Emiliania huxleyi CCMP1516]|uniref:Pyruvate kinase n=2 Tax=Emiliania huxleyi TaxID=2903 RepID=A0A0D3KEU7_EMIH1
MLFARASRSFARALSSTPRLTKIVATIGPASEQAEPLGRCLVAGINVMRVNFSHATVDEFHLRRTNLRAAAGGELVPIMLDTKGPEIRMGGLAVCKEGGRKAKITLTAGAEGDEKTIFVGYPLLASKVSPGFVVLLDDGLVSLRVKEVRPDGGVACEVLNTSPIGERKGLPVGIVTDLPPLSDKDLEDIRFGIEHDIDMVAASFVRNAAGVDAIRAHIADCHAKHAPDPSAPPPLIISKVESTEALDRLGEIIEASDGLMVARGDLGVEVPIAHVATWQKEMVAKSSLHARRSCTQAGKPVVVATQMLDSMQSNPRPTRAEVADVTNAVLEQADAVMLSGESANGQYPAEAVAMQAR